MITIKELMEKHDYNISSAFSDPEHESKYGFNEFVEEHKVWKAEQDAIRAKEAKDLEEI